MVINSYGITCRWVLKVAAVWLFTYYHLRQNSPFVADTEFTFYVTASQILSANSSKLGILLYNFNLLISPSFHLFKLCLLYDCIVNILSVESFKGNANENMNYCTIRDFKIKNNEFGSDVLNASLIWCERRIRQQCGPDYFELCRS